MQVGSVFYFETDVSHNKKNIQFKNITKLWPDFPVLKGIPSEFCDNNTISLNSYFLSLLDLIKEEIKSKNIFIPISDSIFELNRLRIDFRTTEGKSADEYNGVLKNHLYILTKSYAYIAIYYFAYKDLFNIMTNNGENQVGNINILSIGCGAKQDGVGMYYAKKFSDKFNDEDNNTINYNGVDHFDWEKCGAAFKINNNDFINESANDHVESICNNYNRLKNTRQNVVPNVLFYPNSLSEMTKEDVVLRHIKPIVDKSENSVYVVFTYRISNNQINEKSDIKKINAIIEQFDNDNNYNLENRYYSFFGSECKEFKKSLKKTVVAKESSDKIEDKFLLDILTKKLEILSKNEYANNIAQSIKDNIAQSIKDNDYISFKGYIESSKDLLSNSIKELDDKKKEKLFEEVCSSTYPKEVKEFLDGLDATADLLTPKGCKDKPYFKPIENMKYCNYVILKISKNTEQVNE